LAAQGRLPPARGGNPSRRPLEGRLGVVRSPPDAPLGPLLGTGRDFGPSRKGERLRSPARGGRGGDADPSLGLGPGLGPRRAEGTARSRFSDPAHPAARLSGLAPVRGTPAPLPASPVVLGGKLRPGGPEGCLPGREPPVAAGRPAGRRGPVHSVRAEEGAAPDLGGAPGRGANGAGFAGRPEGEAGRIGLAGRSVLGAGNGRRGVSTLAMTPAAGTRGSVLAAGGATSSANSGKPPSRK
jgi:hypothetical protein